MFYMIPRKHFVFTHTNPQNKIA